MTDDQLAELWSAGATLTQIEQATGLSRGVAIGRIHRAGAGAIRDLGAATVFVQNIGGPIPLGPTLVHASTSEERGNRCSGTS
jgi:hypothetical protein